MEARDLPTPPLLPPMKTSGRDTSGTPFQGNRESDLGAVRFDSESGAAFWFGLYIRRRGFWRKCGRGKRRRWVGRGSSRRGNGSLARDRSFADIGTGRSFTTFAARLGGVVAKSGV